MVIYSFHLGRFSNGAPVLRITVRRSHLARFAGHLAQYRQEKNWGRAGLPIARSTLAQWVGNCGVQLQPLVDALREAVLTHGIVHADETPVQMLTPGAKKTHRAYVWAYASSQFSDLAAVVYDFSPSRAGEHARAFLGSWNGKLVCDDFAGYKAGFELGVTEIGCMAHARRKFFDLHATNKSQVAEKALHYIAALYEVEREVRELEPGGRQRIRQEKAAPIADALHTWMIAQRQLVPEGSAIAKALDYSLKRWIALTVLCPSIITGARIKSGRGLLGARTGCSRARYAAVNVRRRS